MNIIWHIKKMIQNIQYKDLNIGKNSRITLSVEISNPHNVSIGDNTYINGGSIVAGDNSQIIIGDNCLISYGVHIRTISHNYRNKKTLIREQGLFEKSIFIEDDVWIGYGAQILPGITIHRGAVIAAGAIVTKDVGEYEVVGGVPAKRIGERC